MITIKRIISRLLNEWSYLVFPHLKRFRLINQGLSRIVLGGFGASSFYNKMYGFKQDDADLTVSPSSVSYMFRILKNYHSYLKEQGEVVLILNPFSLCIDHYGGARVITNDIRYYPILHNAMIEDYNNELSKKWSSGINVYSIFDSIPLVFSSYSERKETQEVLKNLSKNVDSKGVLSDELSGIIDNNVLILKELKVFCDERGYGSKIIVINDFIERKELDAYKNLVDIVFYKPLANTYLTIIN